MDHFNGLTPAEAERLAMLADSALPGISDTQCGYIRVRGLPRGSGCGPTEAGKRYCGEIVLTVGKILRHGYGGYSEDRPEVTNRTLLREEVTDLLAVLRLMDGDMLAIAQAQVQTAYERKLRFSHHQDARSAETSQPDPATPSRGGQP